MAINVSNKFFWPFVQFLSLALRGWSRRQRVLPFLRACLSSLCLASLKCSLYSAASFSAESLQGPEYTDSVPQGRQESSVSGSNEGFPSVSLFSSEQTLPFLDDADAAEAPQLSGASLSPILPAARNKNTAQAAAARQEKALKMHMRKGARLRAAAAVPLLLVFLAVSVVPLVARRRQAATAAAEGHGPRFEESLKLSLKSAEEAAAAAEAKVAYLVKLEAAATKLAGILNAEEAAYILDKITNAVEACKTEAEALYPTLRPNEQQQKEREETEQQGDHLWVAGWARLTQFYSAAIEEVHRLLDTAPAFVLAQAEAASNTHFELMKMHLPAERLYQKAALELEKNLGESLLRVSEFSVSESLKELHVVHEASARFTNLLATIRGGCTAAAKATGSAAKATAGAGELDLVLEQAVAAAQVAVRGRMRTSTLLHDGIALLEDTQKALILLSRSHTDQLLFELAVKKIRMDLTCSHLQKISVPQAFKDVVREFVLAAQEVEMYFKEVQQVQKQLQETTDATEALSCLRRAHCTFDIAANRVYDAPAVFVFPYSSAHSKEGAAPAQSAANGFMTLYVEGESALVQPEGEGEKERVERLRRLVEKLGTDSDLGFMLESNQLTTAVLNETKNMLQDYVRRQPSQTAPSPSAELYDMWKQVEADSEEAAKQLEQAHQRLSTVNDVKHLQLETKEILSLKLELAGLSLEAVHHAADCKAWALAERAFAAALADHAAAAEALTGLQQQQQEQQRTPPNVSCEGLLTTAFKKAFQEEDIKSALTVISRIREETVTIEQYVQSSQRLIEAVTSRPTPHPNKSTTSAASAAAAAAAAAEVARDTHATVSQLLHPLQQKSEAPLEELEKRRTQQRRRRTEEAMVGRYKCMFEQLPMHSGLFLFRDAAFHGRLVMPMNLLSGRNVHL
ncbi:hypothetical protein Esti_006390 [Eimeria stiedai]